jgi:hypothetical protein
LLRLTLPGTALRNVLIADSDHHFYIRTIARRRATTAYPLQIEMARG